MAVENTLSSWRQRILSFCGRALVINALALSRVWYVASLICMPPWVLGELLRLLFSFFWKSKKDLVARAVVVQAPSVGGCSVVDVKFKVQSLLVQWVRRFARSQSSWSGFLGFWFHSVFNSSPLEVLSRPFAFSPRALPPFYQSLLLAWRAVDGSFPRSRLALVMASTDPHQFALASSVCQICLLVFAFRSFHPSALRGKVPSAVRFVVLAYHLEKAQLLSLSQTGD